MQACVDTLTKYLDNILMHSTEEKYRKIKLGNKIFQEKVAPIEGSSEFFIAAGFEKQQLPTVDDKLEEFWVFTATDDEHIDYLTVLKEGLQSAEPIVPELDRSMRVIRFVGIPPTVSLPPDFYNLKKEELMKEQAAK